MHQHPFCGNVGGICDIPGCGRQQGDMIHNMGSPVDILLTTFPDLLLLVLEKKANEQRRSDITKILCTLLETCKDSNVSTTDLLLKAFDLYDSIENNVANIHQPKG